MNATQGSPGIHHLVQPTLQRDAGGLGHRRAGKLRDRRELAIVDTHQAAAIGSDHILLEPGDRWSPHAALRFADTLELGPGPAAFEARPRTRITFASSDTRRVGKGGVKTGRSRG